MLVRYFDSALECVSKSEKKYAKTIQKSQTNYAIDFISCVIFFHFFLLSPWIFFLYAMTNWAEQLVRLHNIIVVVRLLWQNHEIVHFMGFTTFLLRSLGSCWMLTEENQRSWLKANYPKKIRQSCKFFCSLNRDFLAYFPYIFLRAEPVEWSGGTCDDSWLWSRVL